MGILYTTVFPFDDSMSLNLLDLFGGVCRV